MSKLLAQITLPGNLGTVQFPPGRISASDTDPIGTFLSFVKSQFFLYAGIVAVLAIIYSGFMYITSAGNTEQAEKAKKNLTWAIVGLVLIMLSATIVYWVNRLMSGNFS
ncbi:MAG: pilin [Candidatus Berkelbacteria bacterium]